MNELRRKIHDLLRSHGYTVVSSKCHYKWSNGKHTLVVSNSPSDHRAVYNVRAMIRRFERTMG